MQILLIGLIGNLGVKMFVIYCKSKNVFFCKDHNKIIVFDGEDKARWFLSQFFIYATQQVVQNITLAVSAQTIFGSLEVIPMPESITCNTINYDEIERSQQHEQ